MKWQQPSAEWVPGIVSPGGKAGGREIHYHKPAPRLRMSEVIYARFFIYIINCIIKQQWKYPSLVLICKSVRFDSGAVCRAVHPSLRLGGAETGGPLHKSLLA
jgi:hypothetical protein